ncbi:MAG: V-type ATP synthase subunit E [Oscillospiraceae bacterium]
MNGIEKITQRIERDARAEIDSLLQEAGKKADGVRAEAERQAEERLRLGRAQNAEAARFYRDRLVSAAEMEARQMQLAAKQEMLEETFARALEKRLALPEAEMVELLASFAAKNAEDGREELILSAAARAAIGEKVTARANALRPGAAFTLSQETREIDGVILRRGNIEINGSLEIGMRELRQRLAPAVADILFA